MKLIGEVGQVINMTDQDLYVGKLCYLAKNISIKSTAKPLLEPKSPNSQSSTPYLL